MAMSTNSALIQQRSAVEARIKLLINNDLKEICKNYSYPVSGTKAVLQGRCMEILDKQIRTNDVVGFEDLRYRVNNHGQSPHLAQLHQQPSSRPNYPTSTTSYNPMGNSASRSMVSGRSGKFFKPSPFYEILETVSPLYDLPEMPQNRNTEKKTIVLNEDTASKLKTDPSYRLLLFCGQMAGMLAERTDIAFPNQIEVRLNGDEVKHNFKGLKGKPGTTKPADITHLVRAQAGYQTQLQVTYALTTRRFAFTVHLARRIKTDTLIEQIKNSKVIPKQSVLNEMNRLNADPELAATAINMSLKDPISTMRITLPVRSTICTHNQCFDCSMFLQLQEQAPQWLCPICNKHISFSQLCVDKYFEDILLRTPTSIEKVSVEPTGEWTIIKEEEDESSSKIPALKPRASYDDDFDDELIELVGEAERANLVNRSTTYAMSMAAPASFSPPNITTPAAQSRSASFAQSTSSALPQTNSNKRPASAVIDLTLSDDEDEPPRPAKRAPNGNSQHHFSIPLPSSRSHHDQQSSRLQPTRPPSFSSTANPSSYMHNHSVTGFEPPHTPFRPMMKTSFTAPDPPSYRPHTSSSSPFNQTSAPLNGTSSTRTNPSQLNLPPIPQQHNHNPRPTSATDSLWSNSYSGYSTSPE